jgi:DNA (cytosine-5)-methyltransferase 1
LENVPGLLHGGIEYVLGDLASVGFDAEWTSIRASDVGAPHRRERVFILGIPSSSGRSSGSDREREHEVHQVENRKVAEDSKLRRVGQSVRHWLTPSANEDAAGTVDGKMQNMLSHQAQVETGVTSQNDSGQRLNPLFVEWLMGWPEGWLDLTDSESSATE